LSRYLDLNLHRYGKKKVCGKFLFFNDFSDMTFSLTNSWIISDKSKNQGMSERPLNKKNFPHMFFFIVLMKIRIASYKHILIFYEGTYIFIQLANTENILTEHPSNENFRNEHFPGFLHWKFGKVTPKFRCAMSNRLKRTFIVWSNLNFIFWF
jgi:hypothetical protein